MEGGPAAVISESPQPRPTTLLGNILRGRPRNSSVHERDLSPSPPSPGAAAGHRRQPAIPIQPSTSTSNTTTTTTTTTAPTSASNILGLHMLRRRRSAGTIPNPPQPPPAPSSVPNRITASPSTSAPYRIRLVPHLESRRSLRFEAITRDLRESDAPLRIGRFTDRSGMGLSAVNALGSNKLAFKSKVVSRAHAEIWAETGGRFYVKDTKSSSGTFLNHSRLSPANTESRPFQIKDGDIVQLGVDYQGGAEDIYKSVKIRIEIGREWQAGANAFNTNALKKLKSMAVPKQGKDAALSDCCICLFAVTIRQALFIAPCSHTFHYKCIRPLLESHHPAFSCPLCRTFADLEEDVEVDVDVDIDMEGASDSDKPHSVKDKDKSLPGPSDDRASGERDRGAETEVETDVVVPPPRVTNMAPRMDQVEEDEDMEMQPPMIMDDDVVLVSDEDEGSGSGQDGVAEVGSKRKR